MISRVALPLLAAITAAGAQIQPSSALPPQTPIPGAPPSKCEFTDIDASTPIRVTTGKEPIPYQFACGHNRPLDECAINTLSPGLIVNLGTIQNGWACVTGGDSSSGWIPEKDLAQVPETRPFQGVGQKYGRFASLEKIRSRASATIATLQMPDDSRFHGRCIFDRDGFLTSHRGKPLLPEEEALLSVRCQRILFPSSGVAFLGRS